MMAVTSGLAWQVRRSHAEITGAVSGNVQQSRTLSELQQILGRLAAEWGTVSADPTYRPSVDTMQRMVTATESSIRSVSLSPELEADLSDLAARSRTLATEWDATDAGERVTLSASLSRYASRIQRTLERERAHLDSTLPGVLANLRSRAERASWTALSVVYIVALVSFLIASRTMRSVVLPIERLTATADRVARGELAARAPITGDYELAHLSERFNEMTAALAESHARLEAVATTDELTGLANFRMFSQRLAEEIERAGRYELEFGLLIIDLDHFKKYNDTWGHQAGNEALALVSATLTSTLRTVDVAARFGGEELAVIAPQTDRASLARLAERIRSAVAALPPLDDRSPVTVSIGGAVYPLDGATPDALFRSADARLYQAKSEGRNRFVIEGTGPGVSRQIRPRA